VELYYGLKRFNSKGVPTDWATHMIGHELTALYGIDHARTLLLSDLIYTVSCLKLKGKLAQYGKRIFNLTGTDDEIANAAIDKTVAFSTQWEWKLNYLTTRLIIQNS
jgi:alcohol dehydrogenase YqhD (iron-dependent ADH family)